MRYIIYLLLFTCTIFQSYTVYGANNLNRVDIEATISDTGYIDINENWNLDVDSDSELTKHLIELGDSCISNVLVTDEVGNDYIMKQPWDSTKSRMDKYNSYGYIENINGDISLSWGIGDYGQRGYSLSYTLDNFIKGCKDSKFTKHIFLSPTDSLKADLATIQLNFPDNIDTDKLDIHIYGSENSIKTNNNTLYIECSNIDYISILIGYNTYFSNLDTKDFTNLTYTELLDTMNQGNGLNIVNDVMSIKEIIGLICIVCAIILVSVAIIKYTKLKRRAKNKHNIPIKFMSKGKFNRAHTNNKLENIYTTYVIGLQYGIIDSKYSILKVMLLNMLNNHNINIINNKGTIEIELKIKPCNKDYFEDKLYSILYDINNGEIIDLKVIEKHLRDNSEKLSSLIDDINISVARDLEDKGKLKVIKVSAFERKFIRVTEYKVTKDIDSIANAIESYNGDDILYRYLLEKSINIDTNLVDSIVNLISVRISK